MDWIIKGVTMGVLATLVIDLWALILSKLFQWPMTHWGMVGRWLGHIPGGNLSHQSMATVREIKYEKLIGWGFHYLVGIIYAVIYLWMIFSIFSVTPSFLSAVLFGLFTVAAPWFILQPGLGIGVCAKNAPMPNRTRLMNLLTHSLFGAMLYVGWLIPGWFNFG